MNEKGNTLENSINCPGGLGLCVLGGMNETKELWHVSIEKTTFATLADIILASNRWH
jgi:hypothetical protein